MASAARASSWLYDGKDAVCTQSYGPEARGGASRADVVISDHRVDYPFVINADILAVFFQEAYILFHSRVKADGMLLFDDLLVQPEEVHANQHAVPATRIAEDLGTRMAANVVMLGYIVGATSVVSDESVDQALRSTLKPGILDLNLKAFDAGMELAREHAAA